MTEQSPLERAARALCKLQGYDPDQNNGPENDPHPQWWFYVEHVEAVLTAIREPSYKMLDAHIAAKDMGEDIEGQAYVDWFAMIDAALGE